MDRAGELFTAEECRKELKSDTIRQIRYKRYDAPVSVDSRIAVQQKKKDDRIALRQKAIWKLEKIIGR